MAEYMKTLEESIAVAMDSPDTAIVPFLPYILQDFWEIGTPPEIVVDLVQKHCRDCSTLRVLDLGCGKGAVSVKLAAALNCNCLGIDGIPEFIETSKAKAQEYKVETVCRFEVGDIREKIKALDKFDVIVLGAIGQVFGDYDATLTTLSKHLTAEGIIIIDDAYVDDSSTFQHPSILPRQELLNQIRQAEMKLVDEVTGKYSDSLDSTKEMEHIAIRCKELKNKYPENSSLFEKYEQDQADEYDALENEMVGAILVVKKRKISE
jgi:2-polyprenyl-3-methyl-5-hydroxy-6-metoxy-1,4-benzoquinol methylase